MEQTYDATNGTIEITIDGDKICQMEAMNMAIFHTPGSSQVYIDSLPQFQDDKVVLSVSDLLEELGYDETDGLNGDDVVTVTINP